MKKNRWIFAIVVIASLGWVACDDDDDNGLDKPNLNETDETFVETAATSNMAEIEFGQLAATKASDSLVRVYAQEMVTEHTAAQDELEALADDYAGIEWPNEVNEAHEDLLDDLNNAEGASFDSLYMRTQVEMHEDAVAAFQAATSNTTDARVKAYASKYLPHLEMHLEKADSLHTAMTTTTTTDGTADESMDETTN